MKDRHFPDRTLRVRESAIIALVILLSGVCTPHDALAASSDDFLIVPGVSLGPLHMPITEADVMRAYKGHAKPAEIDDGEGDKTRGTILFECDPKREATLTYANESKGRLLGRVEITAGRIPNELDMKACKLNHVNDPLLDHTKDPLTGLLPGDSLNREAIDWEAVYERSDKNFTDEDYKLMDKGAVLQSRWHLPNGMRTGLDLGSVERLNGKPFQIIPHEGDAPGGIDWQQGKLENCAQWRAVMENTKSIVERQKVSSSDQDSRTEFPWVQELTAFYADPEPGECNGFLRK